MLCQSRRSSGEGVQIFGRHRCKTIFPRKTLYYCAPSPFETFPRYCCMLYSTSGINMKRSAISIYMPLHFLIRFCLPCKKKYCISHKKVTTYYREMSLLLCSLKYYYAERVQKKSYKNCSYFMRQALAFPLNHLFVRFFFIVTSMDRRVVSPSVFLT